MDRSSFLGVLGRMHEADVADTDQTQRVRGAIVAYGSATDDNEACANNLEVGSVETSWGRTVRGLKLRGKNVLVSDVLDQLEERMPDFMRDALPGLTQGEWQAAIRMAILTFTALESFSDLPKSG